MAQNLVPPGSSGEIAPDGSPVEIYRRIPAGREPEIIDAAVAPRSALLELGCGGGRMTRALVSLGHRVTAVDQSRAMLALLPDDPAIDPVNADIETLDLGRRFDGVIVASHLLNVGEELAAAFLATAGRHLALGGVVLAEVYPPEMDWAAAVGRRSVVGDVGVTVTGARRDRNHLDATVEYDLEGRMWRQPFDADLLDEAAIRARLGAAGLAFDKWLDEPTGWFRAGLVTQAPG
jgi:SAM-dependent methyltransferase